MHLLRGNTLKNTEVYQLILTSVYTFFPVLSDLVALFFRILFQPSCIFGHSYRFLDC